jgi:putative NADH-flavin reductase
MKVALIGASGFIGSFILSEALNRGHDVTAIVRNPGNLPKHKNLIARKGDVLNEQDLAHLIAGHDAVISAYNPGWENPDIYQIQIKGTHAIINAVKKAHLKRLLMVGGAGSLYVEPGIQFVDTPKFPKQFKEGALATREALNILKKEEQLEWSFLCPSASLASGKRTGKFKLGTDQLIVDTKGNSRISTQDYAIALIDELENPRHIRMRFTVGY